MNTPPVPGLGAEPQVVALGGGHGLASSLTAMRAVTGRITAVVTVADNGGSSGRLREEFGVLPPGDLRMALAALCGDDRWGRTWAEVLQHRFRSAGDLDGHAMGNLLILALWELLGDHVLGLDWVGGLLGARGRVLPMAEVPLDIVARVRGLDPGRPDAEDDVRGQVQVATTPGEVLSVRLEPEAPPACDEAVAAIDEADWVVLGPGSWYSSVIPNLLVPELQDALVRTPARVLVTMNLVAQPGETEGYTADDHLAALVRQAPGLRVDVVLVDAAVVETGMAHDLDQLRASAAEIGAHLEVADVARSGAPAQHDPVKLAAAYARIMAAN